MNSSDHVQDSEQRLRQIVDSIPGLIVLLTAEGQVEFVNRKGLEYFGKTLEELKSWETAEVVPLDDVPPALTAWRHAVETGHPFDFDHRLRRADGRLRLSSRRSQPELVWRIPKTTTLANGRMGPRRSGGFMEIPSPRSVPSEQRAL